MSPGLFSFRFFGQILSQTLNISMDLVSVLNHLLSEPGLAGLSDYQEGFYGCSVSGHVCRLRLDAE